MTSIQFSVGEKGKNLRSDVQIVQTLLKSKGFNPGSIDGICGAGTVSAIRKFQASFLPRPDGLIEPGRATWHKLMNAAPVATKTPSQWSGDSSRWSQEMKIASLTPLLGPKVKAVVAALAARGFKPKVFFGWRSVAVQLEIYQKGNSKVKFSFHCVQKPDGTPDSYAADIVDERYGWDAKAETSGFWKALGEEAKAQGLYWGGDWSSFRDWAHVQLVQNSELGRLKKASGL